MEQRRRTILTEVQGWTPLIDHLVQRYDVTTAAVFGRMWRYTQLNGVCYASLPTIARELNIARSTVRLAVIRLCQDGYLRDLTPDGQSGRPHIYAVTEKVTIESRLSAVVSDDSQPLRNSEGSKNGNGKPLRNSEAPLRNSEAHPSEFNTAPLRNSEAKIIQEKTQTEDIGWFSRAMDELRRRTARGAHDAYINSLRVASRTDSGTTTTIVLVAGTPYAAEWCASRIMSTLSKILAGIIDNPVTLVITSEPEKQDARP